MSKVRVATWNLERAKPAGVRTDRQRVRLSEIDADVWVLTETHLGIRPSPAHTLAAYSAPTLDRNADRGEVWVAIWSRLPVTGCCPTADPGRTAAVRILFAPDRPVVVHGLVLPWRTDQSRRPLRGAAAFATALAEQAVDWDRWQVHFSDHALCIAGDFNQELNGRCWTGSKTGGQLLRERFDAAGLECLTAGSNGPVAARKGVPGIDHICVGRGLGPADATLSGAWAGTDREGSRLSDHHGVWVDVLATGAVNR